MRAIRDKTCKVIHAVKVGALCSMCNTLQPQLATPPRCQESERPLQASTRACMHLSALGRPLRARVRFLRLVGLCAAAPGLVCAQARVCQGRRAAARPPTHPRACRALRGSPRPRMCAGARLSGPARRCAPAHASLGL